MLELELDKGGVEYGRFVVFFTEEEFLDCWWYVLGFGAVTCLIVKVNFIYPTARQVFCLAVR